MRSVSPAMAHRDHHPQGESSTTGNDGAPGIKYIIKRVIGLPGVNHFGGRRTGARQRQGSE